MSDVYTDDTMLQVVGKIMTHLTQNQQLQNLAKSNGLDVKNTIQLTEDSINNVATSTVALMLAKRNDDPDYAALVRAGMSHRKCRCDVINKYKDQANQLIDRYKLEMRDNLSG